MLKVVFKYKKLNQTKGRVKTLPFFCFADNCSLASDYLYGDYNPLHPLFNGGFAEGGTLVCHSERSNVERRISSLKPCIKPFAALRVTYNVTLESGFRNLKG